MIIRAMCTAVYVKGTGSAYSFTAVVIERNGTAALATFIHCDGITTFPDELLVQDIQHLKERSVFLNPADMVCFEMSFRLGILLTPNLYIEIHTSYSL